MAQEKNAQAGVSQNLIGGIVLLALSALALWLTSELSQGTLSSMGAGLLPRWLALAIGLCGVALIVIGLKSSDEPVEGGSWRGIALIMIAIVGFGVMIRPFSMGAIHTPSLGLIIAGPFAVIVGGLASPEARLRELAILAAVLTALCMILFSDLLNLPIPIFPQFTNAYLSGVSSKTALRFASAFLLVAGFLLALPDIFERRRKQDDRIAASGNRHD